MFDCLERLSASRHRHLRLRRTQDYRFVGDENQVPILFSEIVEAAKAFAVVFPTASPTRPVALLGLAGEGNRFVDACNRWTVPWVPAYIRRYPFALARIDGNDDERRVVAVDRAAAQLSEHEGEPLFNADGRPDAALETAVSFLSRFQREADAVPEYFAPLVEHDVLVERTLDIRRAGKVEHRIGGVRVVDRTRLAGLDDATLAAWARSGLLAAVHAHLASLTNLRRLLVSPEA